MNEWSGIGNHNTAEFWEYDTRTGRRGNLDPKEVIGISDYSAFGNNPILFLDIKGDVFVKSINETYTLPKPRTTSDFGKTSYDKTWGQVRYNKVTDEFDIRVNIKTNYTSSFIQPYNFGATKNATLETENPGLLKEVQAHERGHQEQYWEAATTQVVSIPFTISGVSKTYNGDANKVVNDIYRDYMNDGLAKADPCLTPDELTKYKTGLTVEFISKELNALGTTVLNQAAAGMMTTLSSSTIEEDANNRATNTLGQPMQYTETNSTTRETNIKVEGQNIKSDATNPTGSQ